MANGDTNKHADALAALHGGQQDEQPKAQTPHDDEAIEVQAEEDHTPANSGAPTPGEASTSGLVSMLAKNEFEKNARPTPKPGSGQAAASGRVASRTDEIKMAKEIELKPVAPSKPASGVVGYQGQRRGGRKVPGWYHTAIPIMFTVSSLLLLISLWAVGAVIAIMAKAESYPLLRYDDYAGAFTRGSTVFAFVMLLCLPISLALIVSAIVMQRHIATARAAQDAANARKPQSTTPI